MIIALGESIVAIGIGSNTIVDAGVVVAAVLGIAIAAALWWLYFDVIVWLAEQSLTSATPGREQNELARDAYSYIHFPMIAGIVVFALGMKKTLEHVEDPLATVPAAALVGGIALYLLGARRLSLAPQALGQPPTPRRGCRNSRALPVGGRDPRGS